MRLARNEVGIHSGEESADPGNGEHGREREKLPGKSFAGGNGREGRGIHEPDRNRINAIPECRGIREGGSDEVDRFRKPLGLLIYVYPAYVFFEYVRKYTFL